MDVVLEPDRCTHASLPASGCRGMLLVSVCLLVFSLPATAEEITLRDIQVTARALGFMEPAMSGEVAMGLLYDVGSTRSSQQALAVQQMLGTGMQVGNLKLIPVLVPFAEATSAKVAFFLVMENPGEQMSGLRAILDARKLPCLTTDLAQVAAATCTVGIQSAPKVKILINKAMAESSNTRFATVFRMMIVEL